MLASVSTAWKATAAATAVDAATPDCCSATAMPALATPAPPGAIGTAPAAANAVSPMNAAPSGLRTSSAARIAVPAARRAAADRVTQAKSAGRADTRSGASGPRPRVLASTPTNSTGASSAQAGRSPVATPAAHISA
jgi:hypothetical protein